MHWLLYIFFLLSGHLVEEVVAEVDARNSLQRSGKIEAGRSNSDAGLRHSDGELLLWKFSVQKRQKKCCVVEVLVEAAQQKLTTIRKKPA